LYEPTTLVENCVCQEKAGRKDDTRRSRSITASKNFRVLYAASYMIWPRHITEHKRKEKKLGAKTHEYKLSKDGVPEKGMSGGERVLNTKEKSYERGNEDLDP